MSITRAGDFVYALRIIKLLNTPWDKQAAFEHGIIDKDGKNLRKFRELRTAAEKDSYTYLHRMVFNLKRVIARAPGGSSFIGTAAASVALLKEGLEELEMSDHSWRMIEEAIYNFNEDAPANVTGAPVSTDTPTPSKKKVLRRKKKDLTDVTQP